MKQSTIGKRLLLAALLILFVTLAHQSARGQEFRGTVQGMVTDSSKAGVAQASVTLLNVATGVKRVVKTNGAAQYTFDLVDPGTYSITVEAPDFAKSIYEKILVLSRAHVTADAILKVAGAADTVVVEADTNGVDFTSSTVEMTLDSKLVENTPNVGRNPFLLSLVDPSVVDTRTNNEMPYDTWGSNSLQIAGSQNFSNDIQIDGAPVGLGLKTAYVPNTDAVQEVLVQSNAVDAEFGHSGGGIITTTLRSGTNEYHGNVFWLGRYPWLDAYQDSRLKIRALSRQNMFGFNLGNPIIKNKLFNFFSWENWRRTDPGTFEASVPTPAEITGDFSGALNSHGQKLIIYDPWSTQTDAQGNVTRTPFPNSIIPASRIDPNAEKMLQALNWKPNRAPDDPSGLNNWAGATPTKTNYLNYLDRVDYTFRENLKFNGHAARYTSPEVPQNPTGSPLYQPLVPDTEGTQIGANMTYIMSATTIFDVGGSWQSLVDQVEPSQSVPGLNWSDLYNNQAFLSGVAIPGQGLPVGPPRVNIKYTAWSPDAADIGGPGAYWYSHPEGHAIWGQVIKTIRNHVLKSGMDQRYEYGRSAVFYASGFAFYPNSTANTYVNPDISTYGNPYASFLTGALGDPVDSGGIWSGQSNVHQTIITTPKSNYWSFFVNDDWKVNRNLTVTVGLRYEYELPWTDPQNRGTRYLNLNASNPTLASAPPKIDVNTQSLISQLYTGPQHLTSGQWVFSDSAHRGMWDNLYNVFLPRIGAAYRLNGKTAVNAAWARWAQPWVQQNYGNTGSFLDVVYPGFTTDQSPAPMLQGVPQVTFSNPFPASAPLVPAVGKGYGANYGLGAQGDEYYAQNRKKTTSDRINLGVQRELPFGFVGKATYLLALTHDIGWTSNPNMVNPALYYNPVTGPELNQQVPNPFYNMGTTLTFPGAMRYQKTVALGQLVRPYPQYGDLQQDWNPGMSARYQSLGLQLQRSYRNGLSILIDYNYHFEKDQYFYDILDQYTTKWSWEPSANSRHGLTEVSDWQLPVGKGRRYLSSMPTALDYVIGGWEFSHVLTYRSGDYPTFGGMLQIADPTQNIPQGSYFNPNAFTYLPRYTRRTNQNVYAGVRGPSFFNIDATLMKNFKVGEHVTTRISLTGYNALNHYVPADPITDVTSSNFGKSIRQGNTGRLVELGGKIIF